jgi:predicted nucleic-acid-binding Zn-ribbon protein
MKTEACLKSGSLDRERGELFPKGSLWNLRFKPASASELSLKKKVVALACSSCGYIEMYLADLEGPEVATPADE